MGPTDFNAGSFKRNATASWQLALLACTSIALSIASGWTTWDGMENFTDNKLLSFLITFGVQGVMLIAAWLIGQSLIGAGRDLTGSDQIPLNTLSILGVLIGIAVMLTLVAIVADSIFPFFDGSAIARLLFILALVVLAAGILIFFLRRKSVRTHGLHLRKRAAAIFLKHVPLWIMFLTCLAASVFFSFDSLFDTIFSPEERKRASHTRTQSEVSALLSGVSNEMQRRREAGAAMLFASAQWAAYERGVEGLAASAAEMMISLRSREDHARQAGEEEIAAQSAAISAAEGRLVTIEARLRQVRQALSDADQPVKQAQATVEDREKELAAARTALRFKAAEADTEAVGAGITGIAGHGPKFRELKQEETRLQIAESLMERLLGDAKNEVARRIEERDALSAQAEELEVRILGHRTEIDTAKRRLAMLQAGPGADSGLLERGAEEVAALSEAKAAFITAPTVEGLRALQQRCEGLSATLQSVDGLPRPPPAACDARALSEVTGVVFEANASRDAFMRECGVGARGDRLQTDELLQFGQKCLQISGVQGPVTAAFQNDLRQASLRRDDQAHRFVVTWNAFFDRNPLAFVALFIAVAMDGLIFLSGLFGAGVRSVLAANSAELIEKNSRHADMILGAALFPEARERIRIFFESVDFSSNEAGVVGHVDLNAAESSQAGALRALLNAAFAIGMARPTGTDGRFAIQPKLIEMLSCRLGSSDDPATGATAELLRLTLERDAPQTIRELLVACRPLPSGQDSTHYVDIGRLHPQAREQLISVLNAGIAGSYVGLDSETPDRYLLRPAFFQVIARIISAELRDGEPIAASVRYGHDRTEEARITLTHDLPGEAFEAGRQPLSAMDFACRGGSETAALAEAPQSPQEEISGQASLTLVSFPTQRAGRRPIPTDSDLGEAGRNQRVLADDVVTSRSSEALLAALSHTTQLSTSKLGRLIDRQSSFSFAAADHALQTLRENAPDLDHALSQSERVAWAKIQDAIQSLHGGVGSGSELSKKAARTLVAKSFAQIFLQWRGMKEVQQWCENLLSEYETLADAGGLSHADVHKLRRVARSLGAFVSIDDEQKFVWEDLIWRVNGLCSVPSESAIDEIMP